METLEKSARARSYINTDFEVCTLDEVEQEEIEKRPGWHNIKYLLIGVWFGILLVKSEVVSWFRIQEMFRFQSFHMYGIIGSAIAVGVVSILVIKKFGVRSLDGQKIILPKKQFSQGQVYGGLLFGLGWAITGACPGPLFAQVGTGATVVIITLLSAVAGTWVYGLIYGLIRNKLPH